jgi:transposase-like protein
MNLMKLVDEFGDEDACREYLERLRWPNGVACLRCGSMEITDLPKRNLFQCSDCRYQFSVTTDTIMHDTHLPLRKWLVAIYLVIEGKKSISARQLGRTINVAYKTAWHLSHRIRAALKTPDALLSGIIEVDETWVGGSVKGMGTGYKGNKSLVAGIVQRDGQIRLEHLPGATTEILEDFIDRHVSEDAEAIFTDEFGAYRNLGDKFDRHETIQHKQDEYVRGDVHTNSVEGVWSLFKRGVAGSFHKVSKKHLERYLDEFEFRFNNRENPYIFRDALKEIVKAPRLTWDDLVQ